MNITSTVNKGTTIAIELPLAEPNELYPSSISISKNTKILVLDDNPSIHKSWKSRFQGIDAELEKNTVYFSDPVSASKWLDSSKQNGDNLFCLVDQNLRSDISGLEFIEQNDLQHCSIMVTSEWAEQEFVNQCMQNSIQIISKEVQRTIPLSI